VAQGVYLTTTADSFHNPLQTVSRLLCVFTPYALPPVYSERWSTRRHRTSVAAAPTYRAVPTYQQSSLVRGQARRHASHKRRRVARSLLLLLRIHPRRKLQVEG